ncbi:MAG: hypothetical protein LLG04_18850 [Parachlamydia sp.]|jgi:hypothetical protein|nr:hypothetical protein [Parachlamydia sp.]
MIVSALTNDDRISLYNSIMLEGYPLIRSPQIEDLSKPSPEDNLLYAKIVAPALSRGYEAP